jgi:hypothetical protein
MPSIGIRRKGKNGDNLIVNEEKSPRISVRRMIKKVITYYETKESET